MNTASTALKLWWDGPEILCLNDDPSAEALILLLGGHVIRSRDHLCTRYTLEMDQRLRALIDSLIDLRYAHPTLTTLEIHLESDQ
ncbi:MAG: hypothetical protein D6755_06005 [Anaerolineae bacterium]|nr:MAG: hypothetical protein D6755_06005 [Anaerolineae bacterium]